MVLARPPQRRQLRKCLCRLQLLVLLLVLQHSSKPCVAFQAVHTSMSGNIPSLPPPPPPRSRRSFCSSLAAAAASSVGLAPPPSLAAPQQTGPPRQKLTFTTTPSGLSYADVRLGEGPAVAPGRRVNLHFIGRLAGRQGWQFENTYEGGEPFRFTLGKDRVVAGLEEGLLGMREGGRRRLVVPSKLGYVDRSVGPVPASFSNRQRLYATVLNEVRLTREREALGEDLAGVVVLDVEVLRVL